MGTWGQGNFENDGALDFFGDLQDELFAKVREIVDGDGIEDLSIELDSYMMPVVEILAILGEHVNVIHLDRAEVARWQAAALAAYDEQIDGLQPVAGFKEGRRRAIKQTFERLEKVLPQR